MADATDTPGLDFIRTIVEEDLAEGRYAGVVTRFPPEPNGYLHIGHTKAICLNFGIAEEYGGRCHLRYDDTNPLKEEEVYAASMREDVRWLGYDWGEHLYYASDYFEQLYGFAVKLIERGKAYVDSQSEAEIRRNRGSLTEPGTPSPYRDRSVGENLDLFRRMRDGEFADGEQVLRARIDMAHPNMIMRDPILYRVLHASHYRTGDAWCIYPLYDFAHCLEDAIEDITHSLCTLEFENNREIYDWLLDEVGFEEPRPHQYEFARLELEYTVLSKRKLLPLVRDGVVDGWDDPRMFTVAGIRRRGVPPEAVRRFCDMIGVTKANTRIDIGKFEYVVRDTLNTTAPRVMCVLRPLEVELTNWPPDGSAPDGEADARWAARDGAGTDGDAVVTLDAPYWPRDVDREGTRPVPFGRRLFVERTDFAADPPEGWKRLSPGASVRLRHAYVITVDEVVTDGAGEPVKLRCTCHHDSLGVNPEGVNVAGVVHWVSRERGLPCTVRLYDRLFRMPDPEDVPEGEDVTWSLNPDSLVVLEDAVVEPSVLGDAPDTRYQFERTGYFWRDPATQDAGAGERPVFNRIVSLRDTWGRRRDGGRGKGPTGSEEAGADPEAPSAAEAGGRGATGAGEEPERPGGTAATPPGPEDRVSDDRRRARRRNRELAARFERYQEELGLPLDDADVLTGSLPVARFFEAALEEHGDPSAVAAWVVNDLMAELKERAVDELPFDGRSLGRLVAMVENDRVSRTAAREVFAAMVEEGADPADVVRERGLEKVDDPAVLEPVIDELLAARADKVQEYRAGKKGLLGFFIGQVMRRTGGSADAALVRTILESKLEDG